MRVATCSRISAGRHPGPLHALSVVAAGGDEECVWDMEDDVEAKDVGVEAPDPIQVARLEVHVA